VAAAAAFAVGLAFLGVSVIALAEFRQQMADAYVLPAATLLWLMLGCYLLMLGLVGEVALRRAREAHPELLPMAVERTA
jgi:hypothetical protein